MKTKFKFIAGALSLLFVLPALVLAQGQPVPALSPVISGAVTVTSGTVAVSGVSGTVAVSAAAAIPTGYDLVYATTTDFADCAAGGSASNTIAAGTWMLVVLDEATSFCYAGTCAAGGRKLPANAILTIKVAGTTTISCRSAGATGDLQYTKLQ